jgi:hypothetical protein
MAEDDIVQEDIAQEDIVQEDIVQEDIILEDPLGGLDLQRLDNLIKQFHTDHFSQTNVTVSELVIGARLARSKFIPKSSVIVGHCLPN